MQPRRTLNFAGLIGLTFFCVAGGAYGLEDAVRAGGPNLTLLALLVVPWLWSFPMALMTAELSSAMPEDGGYVVWVERAFGRFWGFQEGWLSWLCSFADNALYPVMFVDYLAYLGGNLTLMQRWLAGVIMIGSVTWLNIRGTQLVGATSFLFTLFVLAPFAVMVLVGAPQAQASTWFASKTGVEVGLLLSIILWNSSGWDNVGCCAGEVRRPQQTYPRAMALSVLLVTFAYLLPLAVGVSANQNWADWKEGYFPEVAENIAGPWLGKWLMFAGLVSALGLFNALLCTSSRVPYAMARRRTLPHPLTKLHPHYNTPWVTIIINSVGAAVLIPFSFQDLVQVDMFLYALALVLEFASLVWLRIKEPDMPRAYRVPFGTPGAILISIPPVALCLISMALANEPTKLVSLGGIVLGLVVYAVGSVWRKHHEF